MPDFALQEMELEDAHVWFVRFAMDKQCRTLACGNRQGAVFVWDPQDMDRKPAVKLRREAPPAASRNHTTVSLLTPCLRLAQVRSLHL